MYLQIYKTTISEKCKEEARMIAEFSASKLTFCDGMEKSPQSASLHRACLDRKFVFVCIWKSYNWW